MASDQVGKGNSGAGKGPTARIWAPLLAADRDVLEVQITSNTPPSKNTRLPGWYGARSALGVSRALT